MPFVLVHKARKPRWQRGFNPQDALLRDMYRVEREHYRKVAAAFRDASRNSLTTNAARLIVRTGDVSLSGEDDPVLARRLNLALGAIYQDAAPMALSDYSGGVLVANEPIIKQGDDVERGPTGQLSPDELNERQVIPAITVSAHSVLFLQDQTSRVMRLIRNADRKRIFQILARAQAKGERAETTIGQLMESVGLLPREEAAVNRVREVMTEAGASKATIDRAAQIKSDKLLNIRAERIARTETITAFNRGRQAALQASKDQGFVPDGAQRQWFAALEERTCPICLELDGKTTDINAPFNSAIIGEIFAPPAHVNCRCSFNIVFPE